MEEFLETPSFEFKYLTPETLDSLLEAIDLAQENREASIQRLEEALAEANKIREEICAEKDRRK